MKRCAHCRERWALMTARGLCLPCDIEIDREVEVLEDQLAKRRAQRHYEALAAEALSGALP